MFTHRYVCMLRSFERPIIVYWLKNIWKASTLLYYCTDINPRLWACHKACDVSTTLQDSGLPWADNNLSGLTLRREECSVVWRILIKADYAKSWGQGLTLNLVTGCDNIYRGMSVTWECHVSRAWQAAPTPWVAWHLTSPAIIIINTLEEVIKHSFIHDIHDVSLTFDLCHSKRKSSIIYHVLDMVFDILFKTFI